MNTYREDEETFDSSEITIASVVDVYVCVYVIGGHTFVFGY